MRGRSCRTNAATSRFARCRPDPTPSRWSSQASSRSIAAYVETKNSDYSGLLTANQIAQIQTKGRDVVNLLRLLPGVHYENDIEAMGDSFGSQLPNVGGQRRTWNQVT